MKQRETLKAIAQHAGTSSYMVKRVLDGLAYVAREHTGGGAAVNAGLFRFSRIERGGRAIVHPITGTVHQIPQRLALKVDLRGALEKMRRGNWDI